ncbi:MAG: hypothetical protein ACXWUG_00890 [Polyangiales bacterium]
MHVRLRGNGLLVIPKGKFRFERDAVKTSGDDVEVLPAPGAGEWRIETPSFSIAWPRGFAIADDPDELSPFLLHGDRDALIWTAGPLPKEKVLPVEKLVDEEQRVRAIADAGDDVRIDLDYVVDGEPWWQRRYLRKVPGGMLVLSAQARAADEDEVRPAIDLLDATLVASAPS